MKAGDRVRIVIPGERSFHEKTGTITNSMQPDYDWAVLVDGLNDSEDDKYGFNESELETL